MQHCSRDRQDRLAIRLELVKKVVLDWWVGIVKADADSPEVLANWEHQTVNFDL